MGVIYIPKGKAREYSPLALNIYNGCDHHCKYCYIQTMPIYSNFHIFPKPRTNIIENLKKYLKKNNIYNQVLLCFLGDPYCKADTEYEITKKVLELFLQYNIPTAILSKGGSRILRDLGLFRKFKNIKVGMTLTFDNQKDSLEYEPGASLPNDRIETLKILNQNNIKTWVSFEPVIDVNQTLHLLDLTHSFVDEYQVGKLNHFSYKNTNWRQFAIQIIDKLKFYNKEFYVKKDLYNFIKDLNIGKKYIDMDYLTLSKPKINQPSLF